MMGFVIQIIYEIVTGNTVGGEFRKILIESTSADVESIASSALQNST